MKMVVGSKAASLRPSFLMQRADLPVRILFSVYIKYNHNDFFDIIHEKCQVKIKTSTKHFSLKHKKGIYQIKEPKIQTVRQWLLQPENENYKIISLFFRIITKVLSMIGHNDIDIFKNIDKIN